MTWGQRCVFCKKHIYYDAEILSVDDATVKFQITSFDDGNKLICTKWTCLHENQKYAIMKDDVD